VLRFSSGISDSGSSLLVQIVMIAAYRLLFIIGENAQLMVVTVDKQCFVAEHLLYEIELLCSLYQL